MALLWLKKPPAPINGMEPRVRAVFEMLETESALRVEVAVVEVAVRYATVGEVEEVKVVPSEWSQP